MMFQKVQAPERLDSIALEFGAYPDCLGFRVLNPGERIIVPVRQLGLA